ncbi:NUDIX hydrolase [Maribius pontilimi]|uniref:NUDIX hydrolase n=1 Tax=Palleronia pontilimi TaxID=1964209 RepID=A0A934MDF5_9RHOB|nr:NUDIX hydrolase [Palleronia pontilimi]MBJ3763440.1 NUDIX hydrolase [Palleronia pontilimi]
MGAADARVLNETPVRDAASVVLIRDPGGDPKVLMGQRGRKAVFMPNKFVFPGGRVDPTDAGQPVAGELHAACRARMAQPGAPDPHTLAAAAIRELWEETGQILGAPGYWPDAPPDWRAFARRGLRPDPSPLRFVFRAVTPPGPPRRFDARFFLADAARLVTDPDDFTDASDELRHLQWVPVAEARALDLPFVTRAVLAQVAARLPDLTPPDEVPHFRDGDEARAKARLEQGYTT